MNELLVQGVETARAVHTTTPQGQPADAQFVKRLMDHQKEAGAFTTVSTLIEQLTDRPAASAGDCIAGAAAKDAKPGGCGSELRSAIQDSEWLRLVQRGLKFKLLAILLAIGFPSFLNPFCHSS